jgi:adiponectin receptor
MAFVPRLRFPPEARGNQKMEEDRSGSGLGKAGRTTLLSFDEMPPLFQRDNNQWILNGYRPISNSFLKSFGSLRRLHNETFNIYSHLIPAVVFFLGGWYILQYLADNYPGVTGSDFVAFSFFMVTATICFASSALYHTLMNHSYTVDHFCHRLDMLGIGIFITGDIVLGVYIIFWCETTLRNVYWSMVS